jgi:hypothetical protein
VRFCPGAMISDGQGIGWINTIGKRLCMAIKRKNSKEEEQKACYHFFMYLVKLIEIKWIGFRVF